MFTIYLVGPISGKGYDEVVKNIEKRKSMLLEASDNITVIHPMTGKSYLRNERKFRAKDYRHPVSTNHSIFERDKWMVENSDIVLADFTDAEDESIGSCFELAWASYIGKLVITVMKDENPHQHAFILEASDTIFEKLEDAVEYLGRLANGMI